MNKGRAGAPPLYLMYPVGGNVLCYFDLARFFDNDKPFYAVQAPPPDQLTPATLEELATYHLHSLKESVNGDRYELGGWSFGGLLALEMAQQAAAAGSPPAALYLLDPTDRESPSMDDAPEEELATGFVLTLIADCNGGRSIDPREVETEFGPGGKSLEVQLRKAAEFGLLPAGADIAAHLRSFEIFKRNMHLARAYRARKYSGETTLVLPEERTPEAWLSRLPASTTVVRVAGNHFTMVRGAGAARIAGLFGSGAGQLSLPGA